MEYLNQTMGIHLVRAEEASVYLPHYITQRYEVEPGTLDGIEVVFLTVRDALEPISSVRKHALRVQQEYNRPAVLVTKHLTRYQRDALIAERQAFLVPERQIFLPFMGTYLQGRCDAEPTATDKLSPAAQQLLLYFIYQGCRNVDFTEAAAALGLTRMSISRAARQLEELGLLTTEKKGTGKRLVTDKTPRALFESAYGYLDTPVRKQVYVVKSGLGEKLPLSGLSALAEYSMLNPARLPCYAVKAETNLPCETFHGLQNEDTQAMVEIWKYDPRLFSQNGVVDCLSLALSFKKQRDERVEAAVEEMLADLWERLDGKRN